MITRREDVILAAMVKTQFFTERCTHHADVIASPKLTAALENLAAAVDLVAEAACESLETQGGTPLTPGWHIGEAATQ